MIFLVRSLEEPIAFGNVWKCLDLLMQKHRLEYYTAIHVTGINLKSKQKNDKVYL